MRCAIRGIVVFGIAAGVLGTTAYAQPLAEVARREKARRESVAEKAKVYTNEDLRGGGRLTTGNSRTIPAAAPATAEGRATPDAAVGEDAPAADAAAASSLGDEEYWRNRITVARDARQRSELMASALQNRVDGLWAEFTAVDDPAQRAVVEQERLEALDELERTTAEVAELDQEIRDIQEEARRAGVPPGWLR